MFPSKGFSLENFNLSNCDINVLKEELGKILENEDNEFFKSFTNGFEFKILGKEFVNFEQIHKINKFMDIQICRKPEPIIEKKEEEGNEVNDDDIKDSLEDA